MRAVREMTFILYAAAILFGLKLVWNVGVPIELVLRQLKTPVKSGGISIMPAVEVVLLLLLTLLSAVSTGEGWIHSPKRVMVWGACAILASYALAYLVGMLLGWLVILLRRRQNKSP